MFFIAVLGCVVMVFCLFACVRVFLQGASKRVVDMEWDKFWSTNTRFHDARAGRYMAISTDAAVQLNLTHGAGLPTGVDERSIALHDKNPDVGNKASTVILPQPKL